MKLLSFHPTNTSLKSFPDFYCKYAATHHVRDKGNVLVNELLDNTPFVGGRKFVSVDVKVQHLKLNETTCLAGWHCDTVTDPDAMHHLFVVGENRTQFKLGGTKVIQLPHNHFVTFGSDVEHRGPETTIDETRLLFRVTESNIVKGNSKFYKHYPHKFPIK